MDSGTKFADIVRRSWRGGIDYLYQHSRTQFHPALYVLLYAAYVVVVLTIALWVLGLILDTRYVVDYYLLGAFTACTAIAELTRGVVKHWLGESEEQWSFKAMAAGGASLGVTLWAIAPTAWEGPKLVGLLLFGCVGAAFYVAIGFCLRLEHRKRLRDAHDT